MMQQKPLILVLDDEPMVTTTIKNYLDLKDEYETVVFHHPGEALQYLQSHPVDLIVSDQIMPGMNGLEFFGQVKKIQPEAVRVLLTGYAQKDDAIRAINQVGLYQYIEKPWLNDDLALVIRNGLERKHLYTSLQHRIGELKIAGDEIERLKNGLVDLYLEKSTRQPAVTTAQLRRIVGSEVRSGARRLLYAFLAVSILLLASISYIVYSTFFSIRGETARLKVQLSEIKKAQLNEGELKRWRALMAQAPSEQIIAEYQESVCFIQGSYLFRDRQTGKLLRMGSNPDKAGNVELTLEGDGQPLENFYTGTGFLVSADGKLLTNRHVAQPWWADAQSQKLVQAGFRPEFRLFVAYFPHRRQPFNLKTRRVSEKADIALLDVSPATSLPKPIPLEKGTEGVAAGAPVVLIGFPVGLEALLARSSEQELGQIPNLPNLALDEVARELARRDLVRPFITQGHIGNVTDELLVYDAVTTMGGSGGPLLSAAGKAIAVNFAVMAGFSGASMGLRIQHAMELLKE